MLVDHKKQIMKGTPAKYLGLHLPHPEESPPALWWTNECDHSLVVGILKHGKKISSYSCLPDLELLQNISHNDTGYEQFHLFRLDPALCFRALVGEEALSIIRKKKRTRLKGKGGDDDEEEDEDEIDLSGEESDGESAPSTPGLTIRLPSSRK